MSDNQRKCIIMRGVPSSGKSTQAHWLANLYLNSIVKEHVEDIKIWMDNCVQYYGLYAKPSWREKDQKLVAIHSTDQYLYENGVYKWTQAKMGPSHSKNYEAFRESIDTGIPLVMVDNTNTTSREYTKYKNYAEKNGYWVSFVVMPHPTVDEAVKRNAHNVPGDIIKKMIQRFEA